MPTPATIVLDGTQSYGSRVANINGVAYNAESIKITRPILEAKDFNTEGEPQRQRFTADVATIEATLQLATSSTARPGFGAVWTDTWDTGNYGAESFVLEPPEWDEDNSAQNIRKITVRGRKLLNGTSGNPVIITS